MFVAINPSKQDPTWSYLDKILLANIFCLTMIEYFSFINRCDVLDLENNVPHIEGKCSLGL